MTLTKTITWAAATALALGISLAGPAQAGGTTGETVVLTTNDASSGINDCVDATYTVDTPEGWNAVGDTDLTDPNGNSLGSEHLDTTTGPTQSFTWQLCGNANVAGTYTLTIDWSVTDPSTSFTSYGETVGTFDYTIVDTRAHTRISEYKKKYGSRSWLLTGHLYKSGRNYAHRWVDLQVKVDGGWADLGLDQRTNWRGKAWWTAKPTRGFGQYLFRVRFNGNSTAKPSHSVEFRFPYRSGRVALQPAGTLTPAQLRAQLGLSRVTGSHIPG